VLLSKTNTDNSRSETILLEPATPRWESDTSLNDGTEDTFLPKSTLGRTEKSSILFQPASPQSEVNNTCTTSEKKDVDRVLLSPTPRIKAKHKANVLLSKTNTDNSRNETLLFQPATPRWESDTSLDDGTEDPFLPKSPLKMTGFTFSSGSHVLPGSEPFHYKAGTLGAGMSSSASSNQFGNKNYDMVYGYIKRCSDDQGLNISSLFNEIRNKMSKKEMDDSIEYLSSEGHIYSTVDDEHYKVTDED